jgi:hypothetical protein
VTTKRSSAALRLVAGSAFVLTVALAGPAAAQSKKEQAEVRYDQGKAYYRAGAYDLAIQEFLEGYKLDPRAGVLFNIARGYEELKDRGKAIEYYKKYLDQGAQATAATEARARMVALERAIKDDDERKKAEAAERERQRQQALNPPPMPAPVATVPGAPSAVPAPTAGTTSASAAAPEGSVSAAASPVESPETARTLKLAGIITGGAGVLLAGAGGFFLWRGGSIKSDIEAQINQTPPPSWSADLSSKDADMKTANTLALVGFIAGGAAIAGGAVLYYLGWSRSPHDGGSTAMLSPVIGPGGTNGLALTGRF